MRRSGKQRKAELQLKRAVKRGDLPPPEVQPRKKNFRRPPKLGHSLDARLLADDASRAARKLQSQFIKLDPSFLETTKHLAATLPLPRPISPHVSLLTVDAQSGSDLEIEQLSVPRRPKWKYTMSKDDVDANEKGYFRRWMTQADAIVERWHNQLNNAVQSGTDPGSTDTSDAGIQPKMPRPPTHFERNLEVWRQLWRVTEISQILLCLLDSRCPPLHFPPSLESYLLANRKAKVILVLTKVDIAGPERAQAWTAYLQKRHPGLPIVQVEAYQQKLGEQGRPVYESHLPLPFRERLVDAMRQVHEEMLIPPERVRSDEAKLKRWNYPVKREIDWNGLLHAHGKKVGSVVGGAAMPKGKGKEEIADDAQEPEQEGSDKEGQFEWQEPEFLTVGLIGQPNVGKSSLLNALFGTHKVRASRTPGKTKHFQTLFWTSDVRLVDCPGLVMPAFTPMDTQVLCGILPISRVSAIPFCIHQIAQLLPLETILGLTHPSANTAPVEDKRTWRDGKQPPSKDNSMHWTAIEIMTAYANKKGWVTAKAGRPDIHRAGNAMLRLVAEGKIAWAFWPPGTDLTTVGSGGANGIWLSHGSFQHGQELDEDDGVLGDETDEVESLDDDSDEDADEEGTLTGEDEEHRGEDFKSVPVGRFGVLAIDD
ncbi:P-loop containing nucleoside triphosphate hydrolase protein [Suillus clintonianus]|uniref:P-loop containing nucleoside triphosphate hydrolase protein n=1 Tax=Suillus clintonianus TaxID=1904413 RepID=UPI001B87832D|nr:P-loop containing nucleoside triphosphate hydrolase protein [Suillus clintonianus]KAG2155575.1 P-loop containing nucleoside triphosphate hydrolase protein [Suillus clintonianus]